VAAFDDFATKGMNPGIKNERWNLCFQLEMLVPAQIIQFYRRERAPHESSVEQRGKSQYVDRPE
jgi:hypothetical protein